MAIRAHNRSAEVNLDWQMFIITVHYELWTEGKQKLNVIAQINRNVKELFI